MAKKVEKKTAQTPPTFGEPEFFYDIEQRSEDWFELRRGIPTASKFSAIMADGRDGEESLVRQSYLEMLAGELLSGQVAETFRNEAMNRGVRMEPIAREHYARSRFDELIQVAFVRRYLPSGRFIGCSPDSQVGGRKARKGLEIKSMAAHLVVRLLNGAAGGFPPRFKAQLQGTLLITEWDSIDLLLYSEGMYAPEFTVGRDEPYIQKLKNELEVFDFDLHRLTEKIRSMDKTR